MPVKIEKIAYKSPARDFGACLRLSNKVAELYVTLDFGPRVIHYSLAGGPNVMFTNDYGVNIKRGEDFDRVFYPGACWDIYGGNRIWASPEVMPDTFYPDHEPVAYEIIDGGAIFTAPPQIHTNVQVSLKAALAEDSSRAYLTFKVRNVGDRPKVMAAWSVTAVDAGGFAVIPQPTIKKGVLPNRLVSLWDYTDMTDERVYWGKKYIVLRQSARVARPIKIGINNVDGWACYFNKGLCFICRYRHDPEGNYHDFGASYESYANEHYLEMESAGPLREIGPGQAAVHREIWELVKVEKAPDPRREDELDAFAAALAASSAKLGW